MIKAVIMAGGRGTRIASVNSEIPKPMLPINGKPVLEYEIMGLREQGISDFVITVGHLKDKIIEYFGDGRSFGVNIRYFIESKPLGNAGALKYISEHLREDFLLVNGDIMFDMDVSRFYKFHKEHKGQVTLFTHPNSHPYDSGLIIADSEGRVSSWLTKEDIRPIYYKNCVNAGIHFISPDVLKNLPDRETLDLDREVIKPLILNGEVYAYASSEYVKDMGTPERYEQVNKDCKEGKIKKKSLRNRQRAIFLDRDGTLNQDVGFLKAIEDMSLLPKVPETIKLINESGYLAIVITNQPVIARGEVSFEMLNEIHNKMETLLADKGAYLDDIFFCPHHPDRGFEGEIRSLKIECECRKPKPGLLLEAAEKYNIDLKQSWMIGDHERDIEAGRAAGCSTIMIERNNGEMLHKAVVEILRGD